MITFHEKLPQSHVWPRKPRTHEAREVATRTEPAAVQPTGRLVVSLNPLSSPHLSVDVLWEMSPATMSADPATDGSDSTQPWRCTYGRPARSSRGTRTPL